ncbi:MAG TPA: hypothetical protein VF941_02870 [Clostridia bacterium]
METYLDPQKKPNETPVTLFNPSLKLFTTIYDKKEYQLGGYQFETYPKWLADHIALKLADWYIANYGIKENYELDKKKLLEKIYVK